MAGKKRGTLRLWAVVFWLLVWQAAAMAIHQRIFLVSPWEVLLRVGELLTVPAFYGAVLCSTGRIAAGFLLGAAAGAGLAGLAVRYRRVEELLAPLLLTVKSIPVASFIILALILFSAQSLAVLISFLIVLPVVYGSTAAGIRAADRQLLEMAQVFAIPPGRRLRYIYAPQVAPYFQSACATAVGLAWKSGMAAEVIGMPDGSIGAQLYQAKVYLDTRDLFACTVVIVLLSVGCEQLFQMLLRLLFRALERM